MDSVSPATQRAIASIGIDQPNDWLLQPELHAAGLGTDARALKEILLQPRISATIDTFRSADEEAKAAQRFYKRLARVSAWSGFGAALLGSIVLVAVVMQPLGMLLAVATGTQAALLLISLGSSLLIGSLQPFEAWMLKRAEAESARASLFNEVMAADTASDARALLPLQLEYFRRYQLDVQRHYYHQRGAQHAAAARRAWWWRLIAFLLVVAAAFPVVWSIQGALALPLGYALPSRTETLQRIFLGLGIVAASLQGLLAAFAVMSLDERNAARYRSTAANLDALAGRPLAEARAAAAAASDGVEEIHSARESVLAFVALTQEQISAEHREWIALRKLAPDLALDRLKSLRLPPRR